MPQSRETLIKAGYKQTESGVFLYKPRESNTGSYTAEQVATSMDSSGHILPNGTHMEFYRYDQFVQVRNRQREKDPTLKIRPIYKTNKGRLSTPHTPTRGR